MPTPGLLLLIESHQLRSSADLLLGEEAQRALLAQADYLSFLGYLWLLGASLYFLDPNGHKLEIHASDLEARLLSARERPWEGLELFG